MAVIKCHIKVFIFITVQGFVLLIVLERIYKEAVLGGCPIWVFDLLLTSKVRRGKNPTLRMVLLNVRREVYNFWACQVLIGVCPDHGTNKDSEAVNVQSWILKTDRESQDSRRQQKVQLLWKQLTENLFRDHFHASRQIMLFGSQLPEQAL